MTRTLSHFELRDELGRGGMGVVYRAFDTKLKREVALKVLPPGLVADPRRRQRFVQEARAAAALEHPHIGSVHEIGEADEQIFIAMALIRGQKLSTRLGRGPLPLDKAIDLAAEIAEGLGHAHVHGIVHRDLKPQNVMVTKDGHAQIIDFGLAKLIEEEGTGSEADTESHVETVEGAIVGTAAYMSPEQGRGYDVDHRSDIFSLGTVFHEMVTGQRPFGGPTRLDVLNAVVGSPAPKLEGEAAEVQRIIDKCLAKDPGERYQGMRELVVDLRAAKRGIATGVSGEHAAPGGRPWGRVGAVAATIITLATAILFLGQEQTPSSARTTGPTSVAVIPFEDQSPDPEATSYLSNGVAESLAVKLTKIEGIRVLPWQSSRRYAGSSATLQEIALELGVDTLVVGTISRIEGRVRGSVSLISGGTGMQDWAEEFDEAWSDISSLQERIGTGVVRHIKGEVSGPDTIVLSKRSTDNAEAYELILRGNEAMSIGDPEQIEEALELYENAALLDRELALAHLGVGTATLELTHLARRADSEVDRAEIHFRRALELDPSLHAARGGLIGVHWNRGDPSESILRLVTEAQRFGGNGEEATLTRAGGYVLGGLSDKAIPLLEPLLARSEAPAASYWLCFALFRESRWQDAIRRCGTYLEIFGNEPEVLYYLAEAYRRLGAFDEAEPHYATQLQIVTGAGPAFFVTYTGAGAFHRKAGDEETARWIWSRGLRLAGEARKRSPDNTSPLFYEAVAWAHLGDRPRFEKACEQLRVLGAAHPLDGCAWGHAILGNHARAVALVREQIAAGFLYAAKGTLFLSDEFALNESIQSLPEYQLLLDEYRELDRRLREKY